MTDELIARLVDDLKPVPANALLKVLGLAAAAGLFLSAVAMIVWFGLRPDLAEAAGTAGFWVKFAYTFALGSLGAWAASRVARPGEGGGLQLRLVAGVVVLMAVAAIITYVAAPPAERSAMT